MQIREVVDNFEKLIEELTRQMDETQQYAKWLQKIVPIQLHFSNELNQWNKQVTSFNTTHEQIKSFFMSMDKLPSIPVGIVVPHTQYKRYELLFEKLTIIKSIKKSFAIFPIQHIDLTQNLVRAHLFGVERPGIELLPIPPILYNLSDYTLARNRKILRELRLSREYTLFNPIRRLNQRHIFEMLKTLSESSEYVPDAQEWDIKTCQNAVNSHSNFLLVPERRAPEKSILHVESLGSDLWTITIREQTCRISSSYLFQIVQTFIHNQKYLLLPFKHIARSKKGEILQFRAYVQKGEGRRWEITKIVGFHQEFSDLSTKGMIEEMSDILSASGYPILKNVKNSITNCSLTIATYLNHFLKDLASCTLDFVIDQEQVILLAANSWSSEMEYFQDEDLTLKLFNSILTFCYETGGEEWV